MERDEEGFLYPVTDMAKCMECGLCESICPKLNSDGVVRTEEFEGNAYACRAKDEALVAASSSGGIFTLLAERILSLGGAVYGAVMSEDGRSVTYARTDTPDGLERMRGSKYLQADTADSYGQVREDILADRKVLFTGTPCIISGLAAALKDIYDSPCLTTVSVICHGAPSQTLWESYLDECVPGKKEITARFRDKKYGWQLYSTTVMDRTGKVIRRKTKKNDEYIRLFLRDVALRPSCYECASKGAGKADIILGDAWGVSAFAPEMDDDKGVSVAVNVTERGKGLFDSIRDGITVKQIDAADIIRYNPSIAGPTPKPAAREGFYAELKGIGIRKAADKYAPLSLKARLLDIYRRIRRGGLFALILVMMITLAGCTQQTDTTIHEHEVTKSDWVDGTPATCTTPGTMGHYVCPICGLYLDLSKKVVSDISIDMIDHTLEEWVAPTASTCKEAGIPGYYRCKVCWQVFDADMQRIGMEALTLSTVTHLYGDLVPFQDSTCTEDGMKAHYHCSVCDSYFDEDYAEVPYESFVIPASHKGQLIRLVTEPVEGVYCPAEYLCSVCGERVTMTLDLDDVDIPVIMLDKYAEGVSVLPDIPAPKAEATAGAGMTAGEAAAGEEPGDQTIDSDEPVPLISSGSAGSEAEETSPAEPTLIRDGETDSMLYTVRYVDGETTFYKMAVVAGMSETAGTKSDMKLRLMEADGRDYRFDQGDRRAVQIEGYDIDRDYSASVYELKDGQNDLTGIRANFAGRIFSETVHSRDNGDELQETVTGGAFTGTPVLVYIDGVYSGVYLMGIPEDTLLFETEPDKWPETVALARKSTDQTEIREAIDDIAASGFEFEYVAPDEDGTVDVEYAAGRLSRMISYVHDHNNDEFSEKIDNYAEVDRAIDAMLFTVLVGAESSTRTNIRWVSYDNKHWIPIPDGLEVSFGINSNGEAVDNFDSDPRDYRENFLYRRTFKMNYDDYCARYAQLRASTWSDEALFNLLNKCVQYIPEAVGESEYERRYGAVETETQSDTDDTEDDDEKASGIGVITDEFEESAGRLNAETGRSQMTAQQTRFAAEIERIKDWLTKRLYYLDHYFGLK